jgi:hypothetical protein
MKPAFQIGEIIYARTNRNIFGQVIGIMSRIRSFEYEVKLSDLSIEMFDEYELTRIRDEALAPVEDEDA